MWKNIRNNWIATLFLAATTLFAQGTDIYISSFESETPGSVNGQGLWVIDQGNALISTDSNYVNTGSKGLHFNADNEKLVVKHTSYSGSQQGVSGVVYVDMFVKIDSMAVKDFAVNGYDLFATSSKRAFVMEFDTPSGSSGTFRIYDGSSKTNVGTYHLGQWHRISARVDYDHDLYQVVFDGLPAVTVNFRESYTPTASGTRPANIKEYHQLRFNLGYDGATGSVDAAVDDIYVSTTPIAGIDFGTVNITHEIEVDQPQVGSITLDPQMSAYPDSSEVTATLSIPQGYKNNGWTGDLSGTELVKTFIITTNMHFGADVIVDENDPPQQYSITVTQPDTGSITLDPPGGVYYDYTTVTATLNIPVGYKNNGWTGDLSGTESSQTFVIHNDMQIGADVVYDDTPPTVYSVSSGSELKSVCKGTNLKPGDIVEVEDGTYDTGGGITVESSGTPNRPITIRAKNIGGATLSGETYFTFRKCAYVILEGFVFTSAKYTVVKLEAGNHIRITRNVFDLTESEGSSGKWLYIGGYWDDASLLSHHNRVDHNIFRNKHQLGNFITIDGGDNVSQHDRIDHNYFYDIGPRHENEMEAIRVGWSALSLTDGFTVIENNLFESCDGDPEIVSVKSCKDTVRYNTFRQSQGTLSLRHGDGSVIEGNFFLGEGKSGTGGVRIYARDHKVYNNYFAGLRGSTWDAAITLTNGDTETGSLSAHWRIDNLLVANNSLIDNYSNIEIGYAKADNSWKKEPRNVTMANNLVYGGDNAPIKIMTQPTSSLWDGNIMFPAEGVDLGMTASESEIRRVDPLLQKVDSLWLLSATSPAIDASAGSYIPLTDDMQGQPREGIADVGADEYSTAKITRVPLQPEHVGPQAVDPVSIRNIKTSTPGIFTLLPNYPNPFNPLTTITYQLQEQGRVNLDVFDLRGRRVATLVNTLQRAGVYRVQWQAKGLASGVYLARLSCNGHVQIHKMTLIK